MFVKYYIIKRVNLKFYFDQRRVNPYISSSAPTVDTRAGAGEDFAGAIGEYYLSRGSLNNCVGSFYFYLKV